MLANRPKTWLSLAMSHPTIEQELADLKKRIDTLEAKVEPVSSGAWRKLIGSQLDDELFRQAVRLGSEWRANANAAGQ